MRISTRSTREFVKEEGEEAAKRDTDASVNGPKKGKKDGERRDGIKWKKEGKIVGQKDSRAEQEKNKVKQRKRDTNEAR